MQAHIEILDRLRFQTRQGGQGRAPATIIVHHLAGGLQDQGGYAKDVTGIKAGLVFKSQGLEEQAGQSFLRWASERADAKSRLTPKAW